MLIFFNIILLIIGILVLWQSGEKTIMFAQLLAQRCGLSSFFIGFVLLAISTGIPELSVALSSIASNAHMLSVGDIIGSNFFDIAVVLGTPAFLSKAIFIEEKIYKKVFFMFWVNVIMMTCILFSKQLTFYHGAALLILYGGCMMYLWHQRQIELEGPVTVYSNAEKIDALIKLLFSIVVVIISSKLCVHAALYIAKYSGLNLALLGSTIMAAGTSLPELVLNISAVRKKDYALAIGNSLGSVLEQGSLILGILAVSSSTPISMSPFFIIRPFFIITFIVIGCGIFFRRKINFLESVILLSLYAIYIITSYGYAFWKIS